MCTLGGGWECGRGVAAAQVQQGGYDHARGRPAPPHLAVEDEGSVLGGPPKASHEQGKVFLLGRLLICDWHPGVLHIVAVVCMCSTGTLQMYATGLLLGLQASCAWFWLPANLPLTD